MQKELQKAGIKLSQNELIKELSGIRECWIKESVDEGRSGKITKVMEEVNQLQKELWSGIEKM